MPDWSYRTVLKPALFALPHNGSRRFVLGFLGGMTGLPAGYRVIDFMGHMAAPDQARAKLGHLELSSPIGLSAIVDPRGRARRAFSRFGAGWLTVGPVGRDSATRTVLARDDPGRALVKPDRGRALLSLAEAGQLTVDVPGGCRLFVELTAPPGPIEEVTRELSLLIGDLAETSSVLIVSSELAGTWRAAVPEERRPALASLGARARELGRDLLLGWSVSPPPDTDLLEDLRASGISGIYLAGEESAESYRWGPELGSRALAATRACRRVLGSDAWIATDSGVESPRQALDTLAAGADLVAISSGLVHTGPALVKRCNEALAAAGSEAPPEAVTPQEHSSWFWAVVLGAGMFGGAILAAWIALTSVLMPYDEEFLGSSRQQLADFNPRILQFMTHDRITLAGTMLTIAVLYVALGLFGIRSGHHWAQRSLVYSALFGFFTFFAFLGFGYLDPLHAFVTAVLCQLFLLVVVLPIPARRWGSVADLDNDGAWRRMHWGQLLFVVHAGALLLAGAVIIVVGMTRVFVPQDLHFLAMSPETIASFGAKLVPLIAHDRATFGGMLVASGLAILLSTLWGFRRGDRWQWWALLLAAIPPYAATLWVHWNIGYVNHFHLAPVYIGLVLLALGLWLSRDYLCADGPSRGALPQADR